MGPNSQVIPPNSSHLWHITKNSCLVRTSLQTDSYRRHYRKRAREIGEPQ